MFFIERITRSFHDRAFFIFVIYNLGVIDKDCRKKEHKMRTLNLVKKEASKPNFKILDENASYTYYTSSLINNVTSSAMPVSWNVPNVQLEIGKTYKIRFIDDDDFTSDDIMATCIWEIKASQEGQTTINWNAQSGTISFVAGIRWVYPAKGTEELICVEEGSNEAIGEVLPE